MTQNYNQYYIDAWERYTNFSRAMFDLYMSVWKVPSTSIEPMPSAEIKEKVKKPRTKKSESVVQEPNS